MVLKQFIFPFFWKLFHFCQLNEAINANCDYWHIFFRIEKKVLLNHPKFVEDKITKSFSFKSICFRFKYQFSTAKYVVIIFHIEKNPFCNVIQHNDGDYFFSSFFSFVAFQQNNNVCVCVSKFSIQIKTTCPRKNIDIWLFGK